MRNDSRLVKRQISVGRGVSDADVVDPVKAFPDKSSCFRLVNPPMRGLIVPLMWLWEICNCSSFVSWYSSFGIVVVKLAFSMDRSSRSRR